MKFITSGKNIVVTDALKDRVESKLGKLSKFFNNNVEVHTTLSVEKSRHIVEVTIHYKGMLFRAEQSNEDMYASIDKAVDVLERQIAKNKARLQKRFKDEQLVFDVFDANIENKDESHQTIVKSKKFTLKPMTSDEAILQMNMLGHEFFMFMNSDSQAVNLVYKRKDGNYGLIEPEA